MDEVDQKQQSQIEALEKTDLKHRQEFMELGYKSLWAQRTFMWVFTWLFILSVVVGFLLFHKYTIEVSIVPH